MRYASLKATFFSFAAAVVLMVSPSISSAQPSDATSTETPLARNLVYGELLGAGGLYSLNYERRFAKQWTARIGFSAYSGESELRTNDSVTLVLVPVMINVLLPGGSHNLELGAGPVFGYASARSDEFGELSGAGIGNVSANIAYRYQPVDGGFTFRAGLLPNYSGETTNLWLSLGLGYSF